MGEFFIQMATCKERILEAPVDPGQQFKTWATIADMLLIGEAEAVLPKDTPEGEHLIKVLLAFEDEAKATTAVASVFLLCPCEIEVIAGERVSSALVRDTTQQAAPQQKISTPSLIIPR